MCGMSVCCGNVADVLSLRSFAGNGQVEPGHHQASHVPGGHPGQPQDVKDLMMLCLI